MSSEVVGTLGGWNSMSKVQRRERAPKPGHSSNLHTHTHSPPPLAPGTKCELRRKMWDCGNSLDHVELCSVVRNSALTLGGPEIYRRCWWLDEIDPLPYMFIEAYSV